MRATSILHRKAWCLVTVAALWLAPAGAGRTPAQKIDLDILYAGNPASARTQDFAEFLARHFASVETTDLAALTEEQARRFDVVVLDHDARRPPRPAFSQGYGEPPSKMTEDGRNLFLNCICYIRKFAGQPPLVRNHAMNRRCAFHYKAFAPDLVKKYEGREGELYQLCKDNIELLRYEQKQISANTFEFMFPIDSELKDLGIESNRRIETLEKLIALLAPGQASSQAKPGFFGRLKAKRTYQKRIKTARRLLTRYTGLDFETHEQWRRWLHEHRDRLFFSDFGGYRFYIIPEGYPAAAAPDAAREPFWFPR